MKHVKKCSVGVIAAGMVLLAQPVAGGDLYAFSINEKESSLTNTTEISGDLPGFLIGNFDAKNNPTGTRTLPGLFGGSGNQPVTFESTLTTEGGFDSIPAGDFQMILDVDGQTATLRNFAGDLLNGAAPTFPATLNILYQTFRTFVPDSVFPGGVQVPFELGDVVITSITLTQTADAIGPLVPDGDGYTFTIAATMLLEMTAEVNDQPIEFPPTEIIAPLSGSVIFAGEFVFLTSDLDVVVDDTFEGPFEGAGLDAFPVDVPTVLPPGGTAHLLITNQLESVDVLVSSSAHLIAIGEPIDSPAALDGFSIAFGSLVEGDLDALRRSDDLRLTGQSQFGFLSSEPNVFELIVNAQTECIDAATIAITIEGRLNNPNGQVKVRLRNWNTNRFVEVHRYGLGTTEVVEAVRDISAGKYINSADGSIDCSIRQVVIATFSTSGFRAIFDQVAIGVR